MQFSQLYGDELTRELGSSDTTQLFTTTRRKAAINAGQLEFVKRTECFVRQASVSLSDDTQEYDLDTLVTDFWFIAKQGVSIAIVSGSTVRYLEGDDLVQTSVERLNTEEPGWRAVTASTPLQWYLRQDGGSFYLGFHPKPSIDTETWTAIVPYVVIPTDLTADADVPFTVSGNALQRLRPFHRAIVHFAAYDLEKFRKDQARASAQLQLFEAEVQKFLGSEKPRGGQRVRPVRDYRREARGFQRGAWRRDPRT